MQKQFSLHPRRGAPFLIHQYAIAPCKVSGSASDERRSPPARREGGCRVAIAWNRCKRSHFWSAWKTPAAGKFRTPTTQKPPQFTGSSQRKFQAREYYGLAGRGTLAFGRQASERTDAHGDRAETQSLSPHFGQS